MSQYVPCIASLAAMCALALGACETKHEDECQYGETRCERNARLTCSVCEDGEWFCNNTWSRSPCGAEHCIEGDGRTLCARAAEKDPQCGRGDGYCRGETIVWCDLGYEVRTRKDCSTDDLACAETEGGHVLCAFSSERDPHCSTSSREYACGETSVLECSYGFAVNEEVCDFGCVWTSPGYARCANSSRPSPRCTPQAEGERFCELNAYFECRAGKALEVFTCAPDTECLDEGGFGLCAPLSAFDDSGVSDLRR